MARLRSKTDILNPATSAAISASNTAPASPAVGQRWYKANSGVLYQYTNDGTSSFWLDISSGGIGTSASTGVDFVGDIDPHKATNGTGLAVGSVYYNREKNTHFVCTDATSGKNKWAGRYDAAGGIEYDYVYSSNKFRLHKFIKDATFYVDGTVSCDILCIGGGGGQSFGGGGAGALAWDSARTLTRGQYQVKVGEGASYSTNGGDTSFGGNLVVGKGGGAGGGYYTNAGNGVSGGSGGGAGHLPGGNGGAGSTSGSVGDLIAVSNGADAGNHWGGGGGGAGGNGVAGGSDNNGTAGGPGHSSFVNSSAAETTAFLLGALAGTDSSNVATVWNSSGTLYIAGGGGGAYASAAGGVGGGANGSTNAGDFLGINNNLLHANTGGGAGGQNGAGDWVGTGASGVVIIRYALT